jgi:hypothetical protein
MRHPFKPIAEMSDAEWARTFPDEETCIEWLVDSRWPQDVCCPNCGSDMVFPASLREYRWRCFGCAPDLGRSFDYRTGTIFQDSALPLRIWLKALHHELGGRGPGYGASEQKMRRQIRDVLRTADFRRMVGEPSPVPAHRREPPDAQVLTVPEQESCPQPALLTVQPR